MAILKGILPYLATCLRYITWSVERFSLAEQGVFAILGRRRYVREKVVGWSTRFKTKSRWKSISWIHWLFYKRDLSNSKNVKLISLTQISLVKIFGRGHSEVRKFYRFLIHKNPLFFIHGLPFFPRIICFACWNYYLLLFLSKSSTTILLNIKPRVC